MQFERLEMRRLLSRSWFVSPGGSNSNAGTLAAPLQTIQAAANAAQPGDTVMIEAGTYHETVTPAHSGTAAAPITYEAYNNQTVEIDGADPITGWSNYSGSIYDAPQSWDLGEGNNQVFVNGQMINEARWPNTTLNVSQPTFATAATVKTSDVVDGFAYPATATLIDSSLPGGTNAWTGATIHIASGQGWTVQTGTVLSSTSGQLTFGFEHATIYEDPTAGNSFYLTGTFQALTASGEWYRDPNTGKLYIWTPTSNNPSSDVVEAKHRQYAFEMSGRSYIDVQGISIFAASIDTNASSSHLIFNNIHASYVSQAMLNPVPWDAHEYGSSPTGIMLKGTQNMFENSTIAYSSGDGIYVSGSNNLVQGNTIHDVDYAGADQAGIEIAGSNQQVIGNTIYNAGRDGISASFSTADEIEGNAIYDCGLQTTDVGAIYTWGTNGEGTIIANNTISHMHSGGFGADGVYLDNGSTNYIVDNNTISTTDIPIKVNSPQSNNQIYSNTITGGTNYIVPANAASVTKVSGGVTDLGSLGGFSSMALAINISGKIVGASTSGNGQPGFLYSGGALTSIGTLGGPYSIAYAINSAGQIVGASFGASGARQAFIDTNGVMTSLGTLPGDVASIAFGINDSGTVVGESYNAGGIGHAFVWSNGVMSALPTLGGSVSVAFGVGASGMIVGSSTLANNQNAHAFTDFDGVITDLGTLGGSSSYALAVNSGVIVGESRIAGDGAVHAFVDQNGVMKDLGTLPGFSNSVATGIDSNGDIVGYCYNDSQLTTQGLSEHAFLYRNGVMYDLNTLFSTSGWTLQSAAGVNNSGQIVGSGINPYGYTRAFSVTVPPPATTTATASYVGSKTTTGGSWVGVYGADGYDDFDDASQMPSYVQYSTTGVTQGTWAKPTTDTRGLLDSPTASTRTASYDSATTSFDLNVDLTDGNEHEVSLYAVDWFARDRSEKIQVENAANGAILDTRSVSNFVGGEYLTWNLSGDIRFVITCTGGLNAVASGLFFGGAGAK